MSSFYSALAIEVTTYPPLTHCLYFARGKTAFIKTDAGKKELSGLELVDEIKKRERIFSTREETLTLSTFLSLIDDFKPPLYCLHRSVPSQDAKRYFSTLEVIFSPGHLFYANCTSQSGINHLLRVFTHFTKETWISEEGYVHKKMEIAYLMFKSYLNELNHVDALENPFSFNVKEMMSNVEQAFENLMTTIYEIPPEDELLIRFILHLSHYRVRNYHRLSQGQYADIPESLTQSFRLLAAREFSIRFGVAFPDPLEDFSEIKILCQRNWEEFK